jgi:hypothetical protein
MKIALIILLSPLLLIGFVVGLVRVSVAAGQEIAVSFGRWIGS